MAETDNTTALVSELGDIAIAAITIGLGLAGFPDIARQAAPAVVALKGLVVRLTDAGITPTTTGELQALIDKVAALPDLATKAADASADPGMTEREPEV